jgi:hypothetical protein
MRREAIMALIVTTALASAAVLGQGFRGFRILDEAPLDQAVDFPRTRLVELYLEIERDNIATTRLIEGVAVGDDGHSGGDERFITVGDMIFIPAGVPHGMKETRSITWLNIRFPEHRN